MDEKFSPGTHLTTGLVAANSLEIHSVSGKTFILWIISHPVGAYSPGEVNLQREGVIE